MQIVVTWKENNIAKFSSKLTMMLSRDGLYTFLLTSGAMTVLSLAVTWYEQNKRRRDERKLREKVLSSPDAAWKRVAKVSELFCYPLKSGKSISIVECYFSEYGITIDGGVCPIQDRMFVAFDEKTRKFVTARSHPKMLMIRVSFVTENRARFEVDNMLPLEFDLPSYKNEPVSFTMWYGEDVSGIDCGSEPSRWLSKFLNGAESGVRLAIPTPDRHRTITKGAWKPYAQAYTNFRDKDAGLFSDAASYMLLSQESVDDLNKRMEKPIRPLQLRPNLVVEGCEPFAEDKWDWIKIGETAIIRSFKPCVRCVMTTMDPETGIPDPKYEPLMTLRKYRKLKDPVLDALENYAPAIGVYCGLYHTGTVRIGDDVYVYQDN